MMKPAKTPKKKVVVQPTKIPTSEETDTDEEIMYEICEMDSISGGIKEEVDDDDRDFLRAFLPHMKMMNEVEKSKFKVNAQFIAKKVLSMRI